MTRLALGFTALFAAGLLALPLTGLAAGTTLTVSSPVILGQQFTVAGCGYPPNGTVSFEVSGPRRSGIHYFTSGEPVDGTGCFSDLWTAWWGVTGDYQITSYYRDSRGSTHKAAVVKFSVTN